MKYLSLITVTLLLTACGNDDTVTVKKTADTAKSPAQRQNFADPQIQAYKKAEEVQATIDAANENRKAQMEKEGI